LDPIGTSEVLVGGAGAELHELLERDLVPTIEDGDGVVADGVLHATIGGVERSEDDVRRPAVWRRHGTRLR
jgi:hypothetical protein